MNLRYSIRTAQAEDWHAITALLAECRLPVDDLQPALLADFLVAEVSGRIAGVVGCEPRGDCVLFRSLAVVTAHRGQGFASALTAELERRCKAGGAHTACLLTNTAGNFAARHGFRILPRTDVPAAIQKTASGA